MSEYTRFNSRRKPELLAPDTYSLLHYREAERVVQEYNDLADEAERIYARLDPAYRDAYFQLVLYPVLASANLHELYVTVGKNRLTSRHAPATTDSLARRALELYARDAELTRRYHEDLAGGKWEGMMLQTHIGYTYWQQPEENAMPEVYSAEPVDGASMAVAVEGSEAVWPDRSEPLVLQELNPWDGLDGRIEVFNRGSEPFRFAARAEAPYVHVTPEEGVVRASQSLLVRVDWQDAPAGKTLIPVVIEGSGGTATVSVPIVRPETACERFEGSFVETRGTVSMEASHFTGRRDVHGAGWRVLPGLGRTLDAVASQGKVTGTERPALSYGFYLFEPGDITVWTHVSPTLNYDATEGLRFGISIDDGPIQVLNMHEGETDRAWERWVSDNINAVPSGHTVRTAGRHTLHLWMIDPDVVVQKIVIDAGGMQPSYLGPPESPRPTRD